MLSVDHLWVRKVARHLSYQWICILLLGFILVRPIFAQMGMPYIVEPNSEENENTRTKVPTDVGEIQSTTTPNTNDKNSTSDNNSTLTKEVEKPKEEHIQKEQTPNASLIEPLVDPTVVSGHYAPKDFAELWAERQKYLKQNNNEAAQSKLQRILKLKQESGWANFSIYAAALIREGDKALTQNNSKQALRLAQAAQKLAPHQPSVYLGLARTYRANGNWMNTIGATWHAYILSWKERPYRQAKISHFNFALIIGLMIATLVFLSLTLIRYFRFLLHDFTHVLPKGCNAVQSFIILMTVFLVPVFFHLGWIWMIVYWLTLFCLYYTRRERVGVIFIFLIAIGVSLFLPRLTEYLSYPGSRSENIFRAIRDMNAVDAEQKIRSQAKLTAEEIYALGLRAKWAGDYDQAIDLLSQTQRTKFTTPEIFTVLGNIKYRSNDKTAAIGYYNKAITVDPGFVYAHFNISRVYYAMAEQEKAGSAHRRATAINYELVDALQKEAKKVGSSFLAEPRIPQFLLKSSLLMHKHNEGVANQIWTWFTGNVKSRYAFASACFIALLLVLLTGVLKAKLKLTNACHRCGAPACLRCNPELKNQYQCGPCFYAFVKTSQVDKQTVVKKEIQIRRYKERQLRIQRFLAIAAIGTTQILRGAVLRGLVFISIFVTSIIMLLSSLDVVPKLSIYTIHIPIFSPIWAGALILFTYLINLWDAGKRE